MAYQGDAALYQDVVGLIPAGGYATRIEPLPCSKELYPVGFRPVGPNRSLRPKVVAHYLLEKMQQAGASKIYVVLRNGKWDIPAYFGDGTLIGCPIAYLMLGVPFGVPYTLDQAWPFVQNVRVVFGFPDILCEPHDAFVRLLDRQAATKADIVLGLFPAHDPSTADMVELDGEGRSCSIKIKPPVTDLCYTWIIAVWTPVFGHFMHQYLAAIPVSEFVARGDLPPMRRELFVGDVIQAALDSGLQVETVLFPEYTYLDIGTPKGLEQAHAVANRLAYQE